MKQLFREIKHASLISFFITTSFCVATYYFYVQPGITNVELISLRDVFFGIIIAMSISFSVDLGNFLMKKPRLFKFKKLNKGV